MEPIINDSTADLPDDELTDKDLLDRYKMEIQLYEKEYKPWETRSTKIIKRYKDERAATQTNPTRFNILYSNVQTLFPAAYGNDPKPDIQRRFKDDDVIGRVAADVLERCTAYQVNSRFSDTIKHALQDRLLPGRGVSWVRYEPHFKDAEIQGNTDGQITDDVYEPVEELSYEEVCHDYVNWKDFGHNVARIWDEVYVGWKKAYLTKQELIDRFGKKIAALCPMDYSPRGLSDEKKNEVMKKSTIFELCDKTTKKFYWVHKDVDQFLDVKDDPLKLPEFFPFPKPLLGIVTNDSLVPVPDYTEYQDQAMELDELTSRISQITKSIKVVGVYDASAAGVERMLNEGVENRLIAVESWAVFGEKGGLQGAVQFMPMKELMEVLLGLYEAREKVKADLYEITGIADIIRGATKASETATAQNIKSQFATLRLDSIQHSVARFAKDMVVNTALIIAQHFSLDTIKQISGVKLMTAQEKQQFQLQQQQAQAQNQPPPPISEEQQELLDNPTWEEVYALFKDQPHLLFKIDIETDSTIKMDQQQDQQARMELLEAAGSFMQQASEISMQQPELMPLMAKMLLFGVRGFKVGKDIEGTFRTVLSKIEKDASQPKPPKPDPEMEKIKAQQQTDQARIESDKLSDAARIQADKEKNTQQLDFDYKKASLDAATDLMKHDKTLESQKQIASISTEAAAKPQIMIDPGDALNGMTESFKQMAQDNAQAISASSAALQQTMESIVKSQNETAQMLVLMAKSIQTPKKTKITLDNGRTAITEPA